MCLSLAERVGSKVIISFYSNCFFNYNIFDDLTVWELIVLSLLLGFNFRLDFVSLAR